MSRNSCLCIRQHIHSKRELRSFQHYSTICCHVSIGFVSTPHLANAATRWSAASCQVLDWCVWMKTILYGCQNWYHEQAPNPKTRPPRLPRSCHTTFGHEVAGKWPKPPAGRSFISFFSPQSLDIPKPPRTQRIYWFTMSEKTRGRSFEFTAPKLIASMKKAFSYVRRVGSYRIRKSKHWPPSYLS